MYGLSKPHLYGVREDSDDSGDDFQALPSQPTDHFEDHLEALPSLAPAASFDTGPISSSYSNFPAPPTVELGFQIHARRKILAALDRFETNRIAALNQDLNSVHKTTSSKVNLLEFRAKYIRSTTPAEEGGSTRITRHAVPLLHPHAKASSLPSITGAGTIGAGTGSLSSSTSIPLFSPRSFDRPARTPFIAPPPSPPKRLSTPEFKAAVNFKLGPEAPLLWNTIKMTKRQYPKEHGGAELRGQTRALAYRYMRYIYGSKDFSDNTLREFMEQHKEERVRKDKESRKHENVLADVIREALDKEEVSNIPFNKNHITDQQMKLIMLKAATTQDQLQLFYLLVDEVTEEFLNDRDVPLAKRAVEEEIIRRENDQLFNMDPILSTYTLRQLRDELKRYGKDESEFRAELSKLPDVESPAIRGVLRKQCLISILLEQRTIHGHLQKDQARVVKAVARPWTRIIRTGTASKQEDEGADADEWERRRRRLEKKKQQGKSSSGAEADDDPDDLFEDLTNKTVVDPYVRSQLVDACLQKYATAAAMREVMVENKVDTKTPKLKGEERRNKLANNLVDSISKNDDLFRAWKAVLLQGGEFKVDTSVADDLLQNNAAKPASRSLSTRGSSSRRRNNSSRLRLRPQSQLWRPDNVAKGGDYFTRPSTDRLDTDWVKRVRAGTDKQQEWFNKITGEVIVIQNFFSPESEAGGFGVEYLEKLLSRGVSLPTNGSGLEGGSLADYGFVPDKQAAEGYHLSGTSRPATGISEIDGEFEDYMHKQKLRLSQSGLYDNPGSNVAYQRSLLRAQKVAQKKFEKKQKDNVFVIQGKETGVDEGGSDSDDSDVSDTEYIARYVVKQIEVGLPQFVLEDLLMRFGAGPSKPIKKAGGGSHFTSIEFRDENYQSMEDFLFYYSRLEVPVARNKALLLRELIERVKRRNWDGTDEPDTESEGEGGEEGEEEENAFVVKENEEEGGEEEVVRVPPKQGQKLEWNRYTDDNGYPYFYNWKTGASTYENPYLSQHERDKAQFPFLAGDSSSESDDDEVAREKEAEKQMAESIMVFCAIMMQRNWRRRTSRNETRAWLAKTFRKVVNASKSGEDDVDYVYENVETGDVWKKRPVLFGLLWPNSKF